MGEELEARVSMVVGVVVKEMREEEDEEAVAVLLAAVMVASAEKTARYLRAREVIELTSMSVLTQASKSASAEKGA